MKGRGEETRTVHAGLDPRYEQRRRIGHAPLAARLDLLGEIGIKLRKNLEIALGMSCRDARRVRCRRDQSRASARRRA